MSTSPAIANGTSSCEATTDVQQVDFYGMGLAGCIARLAVPLREQGTVIRWETPHHGMDVSLAAALLLYRSAQEILAVILECADAAEVTIRLASVWHGVELRITHDSGAFDANAILHPDALPEAGLLLTRSAVAMAGGSTGVEALNGGETSISVILPVD